MKVRTKQILNAFFVLSLGFLISCSNTSVSGRLDPNAGNGNGLGDASFQQEIGVKTAEEVYRSMVAVIQFENTDTIDQFTSFRASLPVNNSVEGIGPTHYNGFGNLAYEICKEALSGRNERGTFLASTAFINSNRDLVNMQNNAALQASFAEFMLNRTCGEEVIEGGTPQRAAQLQELTNLLTEFASSGVSSDLMYRSACTAALASTCITLF